MTRAVSRTATDRVRAVRESGDCGQLLLLVLAYTVIAALLVTVVVDVSQVFLQRRALVAAADGAALSAANAPDLDAVYAGAGDSLPLSRRGAEGAVQQYARDAELADRFDDFEIVGVETDGVTVTVTLGVQVSLPLVNVITERLAGGYPLRAVARARSPLTGP